MTEVEQSLVDPLLALKSANAAELLRMFLAGLSNADIGPVAASALERLGLAAPSGIRERAMRILVTGALRRLS